MANPHVPYQQPFAGYAPAAYPSPAEARQQILDDEHLRLLRIGYFISAGQMAVFIPFGLVYAVMGLMFSHLPSGGSPPPPAFVELFFGIFGAAFAGFATLATAARLVTAMRLKQRRSRTFCLVVACFSFLEVPYGSALAIMTFVVLGRPSVQRLFELGTHGPNFGN